MFPKSINTVLSVFILMIIFTSCAERNLGTPTGIVAIPAEDATINYGHSFQILTYMTYSSGKRKLLNGKKDIEFVVKGGDIRGEIISIPSYPKSFGSDSIYVTARYNKKDLSYESNTVIPYNYKGDLELRFDPENGVSGEDGSKGKTALLFRYGKDGGIGTNGTDGENGNNLSVHIYKNQETSLYFIRVMNITTSEIFYFNTKDVGYAIKIYLQGGNGGSGGEGGNGGDGKDGEKTEKKTKKAGAGGNGGDGGNGGNGGIGGSIYVFIHPSADGIQKKFAVFNTGGSGGAAGEGGKGGTAGTPLEGQSQPVDGTPGTPGIRGLIGNPGEPIQISVEDFDIDF